MKKLIILMLLSTLLFSESIIFLVEDETNSQEMFIKIDEDRDFQLFLKENNIDVSVDIVDLFDTSFLYTKFPVTLIINDDNQIYWDMYGADFKEIMSIMTTHYFKSNYNDGK